MQPFRPTDLPKLTRLELHEAMDKMSPAWERPFPLLLVVGLKLPIIITEENITGVVLQCTL